ncbi:Prolyl 4-hydroxylase 1 [Pseudocercospora fuligena]|uniref:Prolyl 4-hydroxylase 1 n=1 Tax=Pseudocercospora fuligena TaxID=685502 RepID=A0A8H6REC8_9PEZI|nr:Prolyl 4-hydroxylase 1 [Pseudocercospora fuligena]
MRAFTVIKTQSNGVEFTHWLGFIFLPLLLGVLGLLKQKEAYKVIHQDYGTNCEQAQYTVRTISYDPLIQHIENLVTPREIQYLLTLAKDRFNHSTAYFKNGSILITSDRTSSSAFLPSNDPTVKCILARVAEYQGYADPNLIEELQVTRYLPGQFFGTHYDWLQGAANPGDYIFDRDTTFFATLEATCSDCGTWFSLLNYDWTFEDPRWCSFVDCNRRDGLTVKPVPGSAVFWKNLHENGTGDERMLHAGLSARDGFRTGLNIWTRREFIL